jgi:hypothetical protein
LTIHRRASESRTERVDHLLLLGEATSLVLRKDELAVAVDVVDATIALDQLGIDAEFILDPGRQTGGAGEIVSTRAVGDRDFHRRLLLS